MFAKYADKIIVPSDAISIKQNVFLLNYFLSLYAVPFVIYTQTVINKIFD